MRVFEEDFKEVLRLLVRNSLAEKDGLVVDLWPWPAHDFTTYVIGRNSTPELAFGLTHRVALAVGSLRPLRVRPPRNQVLAHEASEEAVNAQKVVHVNLQLLRRDKHTNLEQNRQLSHHEAAVHHLIGQVRVELGEPLLVELTEHLVEGLDELSAVLTFGLDAAQGRRLLDFKGRHLVLEVAVQNHGGSLRSLRTTLLLILEYSVHLIDVALVEGRTAGAKERIELDSQRDAAVENAKLGLDGVVDLSVVVQASFMHVKLSSEIRILLRHGLKEKILVLQLLNFHSNQSVQPQLVSYLLHRRLLLFQMTDSTCTACMAIERVKLRIARPSQVAKETIAKVVLV